MPITLTITEDTLDELYATAARFAGSMPSNAAETPKRSAYKVVTVPFNTGEFSTPEQAATFVRDFEASAIPAAPTGTSGDIRNIDADQDGSFDQPTTADQTLDSAGIPWDERIHASTRTTKADGTWTRRRNTDDIYYASVMAELTEAARTAEPAASPVPPTPAHVDGPAVPAIPAPPSVPAQPLAAPAAIAAPLPVPPVAAMPTEQAAPEAPAVPAAAPSGSDQMTSVQFMPIMAKSMASGRLTNETMAHYLGQFRPGLTQITQLLPDPVGLKQFYDWMKPTGLLE